MKTLKRTIYELKAMFLTMFGNIKMFKWPMFLIYDPTLHQMTGKKILQVLDILQPGDIILRGYTNYVDGWFVPGDYSHGAIYVGDNQIVHAVVNGVSTIDTVEFCMCDRICILRPSRNKATALKTAKKLAKENVPYDFGFKRGTSALYCFELCAECYKKLDLKLKTAKAFFGLLRKKDVYLADSFLESPDFIRIFEFNPKRKVDYLLED